MNRSALACAAIAAVIIVTACSGPEAVPEAPIETVSNAPEQTTKGRIAGVGAVSYGECGQGCAAPCAAIHFFMSSSGLSADATFLGRRILYPQPERAMSWLS